MVTEVYLGLMASCYAQGSFLAIAAFINFRIKTPSVVLLTEDLTSQRGHLGSCHNSPGDNSTPGGRRKTILESHIALNTYVPPGCTFTVIDVGMRRSVFGTGDTVKTCCPAGKKPW